MGMGGNNSHANGSAFIPFLERQQVSHQAILSQWHQGISSSRRRWFARVIQKAIMRYMFGIPGDRVRGVTRDGKAGLGQQRCVAVIVLLRYAVKNAHVQLNCDGHGRCARQLSSIKR